MSQAWVIVTEERQAAALVHAARGLGGQVVAAVVGPRALAEAAAAAGPDAVQWFEPQQASPAEAWAGPVAEAVAAAGALVAVTSASAQGRVLAGATAARLGAALVPRLLALSAAGETVLVEREALDGRVIETLECAGPVVGCYGGQDREAPTGGGLAPIEPMSARGAADIVVEKTEPAAWADAGITTANIVVSVGRGLKSRDDLGLIAGLAEALGAEIGCSMPVADDLGWVEKERYVGRSGQQIAPRLYLALGIQGAPQHMEGVRGAKVVVGVNSDPEAPIFKTADYGIVGDLYEVVPALRAALGK